MLCRLAVTAVIGHLTTGATALAQTPIVGAVTHVKDGDTLCVGVHSLEVRLAGIVVRPVSARAAAAQLRQGLNP